MSALFKKKPVKVEEPVEEEDDDLEDLEYLEEDEEMEREFNKKPMKKEKPKEEEIPEPPQPQQPERDSEQAKADLKITANRHYEIVNQLKGRGKITEKSDLKYGGVKSKDELYREFITTNYSLKLIVSELIEDHKMTEKEIETLIKEAKSMDVEELL